MFKLSYLLLTAALTVAPAFSQSDANGFLASFQKHLAISKEFTLKVAEAMPAENYDFKLTPEQMSFGGQMTHLSGALGFFIAPFTDQKPATAKPASASKADVIAFVTSSFDAAIAQVAKLTPEQISKTYGTGTHQQTGYDALLHMLDHNTNHRASAEMYLRAKGIKPPAYEF